MYFSGFYPMHLALLVVGDTTAERILPQLEECWAHRFGGQQVAGALAPPEERPGRLILVDQPGSNQTLITLSLPAPPPGSSVSGGSP